MGFYIIEINDKYKQVVLLSAEGDLYCKDVAGLMPYTKPDLDAIKQEEYEKGYKTAKVQCNIQAEKDLREVGERHYQKGLSDAWEAARKIYLPIEYGGIPADVLRQMFDNKTASGIFKKVSVFEAIEKIREYEQEQEKIKVGDEVISPDGKAVVTEISDRNVRIMYSNGSGYVTQLEELTKTGRHFSEISAVLAKMKEES